VKEYFKTAEKQTTERHSQQTETRLKIAAKPPNRTARTTKHRQQKNNTAAACYPALNLASSATKKHGSVETRWRLAGPSDAL
jgi:hypothetical protein